MSSDNAYMAGYMLKRYHRRRDEAIAMFGGCCADCRGADDLQFHHQDPTVKEFTLGAAFSGWSDERIQAELAKCVLLCADCHKKRHNVERAHGTAQKYWQGCRCEPCVAANRLHSFEWRRRTGRVTSRQRVELAHGTRSKYARGCRCEECRRAQRDYQRSYREQNGSVA